MRVYTLSFTEVAITVEQDLFEIEALVTPVTVLGVVLGQTSDVGDAVAENLSILFRRFTDALANVTAEVQLDLADSALSADLAVNVTTELVTGTSTIHADVWNIALPFIWLPPPEMRIIIPVDDGLAINLNKAPADSLTCSGTVYLGQSGG